MTTTTASVPLLLVATVIAPSLLHLTLTLNFNLDLAFEAQLQRLDVKECTEASSWHALVLPPQLQKTFGVLFLLTLLACC